MRATCADRTRILPIAWHAGRTMDGSRAGCSGDLHARGLGVVMCELFAMSARFPTTIHLSMSELARHGGGTGPHRDGWGVGYVRENDAIVVREPAAANTSEWLAFVQHEDPKSDIVLA